MKSLFITATGTGTGKTYVTAALAAALMGKGKSVRVLKPVISGFNAETAEASDTFVLTRSLGLNPTPEAVEACSPWRFTEPLSPDMAAKREDRAINLAELVGFCREAEKGPEDVLLCEGIGGAMVPLDDSHTVLDWMAAWDVAVLVVAGSYLGTLSHILTTATAIQGRGIKVAGVVISESEESPVPVKETVKTLVRFLPKVEIAAIERDASPETVLKSLSGLTGL